MAVADPEATTTNPSVQALYTGADSYSGLGGIEAALGAESRQGQKNRVEHWQQAVSWYKHSLEVWGRISGVVLKNPARLARMDSTFVPPSVVSRRLAQSKAVLAQLRLGYWPPKSSRRRPANRTRKRARPSALNPKPGIDHRVFGGSHRLRRRSIRWGFSHPPALTSEIGRHRRGIWLPERR